MKPAAYALISAFAVVGSAAHAQPVDETTTIGETITAIYAGISGPPGEARDFDLFRAQFHDEALMGVSVPGPDNRGRADFFTVEEYIERNGENLTELGFTETETRRETWVYGDTATVYSAYEGVRTDTGEQVTEGVNVITLARVDGDWKVFSLIWRPADAEWPVERGFE